MRGFRVIRGAAQRNRRHGSPLDRKLALTIREAAEYSNIGINRLESLLKPPGCPFVLYAGARKLVKRREFKEFIGSRTSL